MRRCVQWLPSLDSIAHPAQACTHRVTETSCSNSQDPWRSSEDLVKITGSPNTVLHHSESLATLWKGPGQIQDGGASKDSPVGALQALLHTPSQMMKRYKRFKLFWWNCQSHLNISKDLSNVPARSCSISWTRSWKDRNSVAAIIELYAPQARNGTEHDRTLLHSLHSSFAYASQND